MGIPLHSTANAFDSPFEKKGTAADLNYMMDDRFKYTYSTEVTWDEIIVTKEAIARHRKEIEEEHEKLQERIRLARPIQTGPLHEKAKKAIFNQRRMPKHIWMQRDSGLTRNLWTKKITVAAMELFEKAFEKQNIKVLLYWCDPEEASTTWNTELTIMTLLLYAMRLYAQDPHTQPKPGVSAHLPYPGVLDENPLSFAKILDMLLKVLDGISGPIICILGDVEYLLLANDDNAGIHHAFLGTFFRRLSERVKLCIVSKMESPEKFNPLSASNPRHWVTLDMRESSIQSG